jgi:hypothetical protein
MDSSGISIQCRWTGELVKIDQSALVGRSRQTFRIHLSADIYRHYFRSTTGVLDGLRGIFCREFPHDQSQLAVACHLKWNLTNALHVYSARTGMAHSYNKLDVGHHFSYLRG